MKSSGSASSRAHTMLVRIGRGIDAARPPLRERVGQPARTRVVVGEALDHRLERDDARGRDHAGLAHAAAEAAALHPGLGDHVGRTAQHRTHRRAQALREAEHHGVGAADQLARRRPGGDRRVPDARAVDVHAQPARRARARPACASRRRRSARPTSPCRCSRARASTPAGTRRPFLRPRRRCRRGRPTAGASARRCSAATPRARTGTRANATGTALRCPDATARGSPAGSPSCPTACTARLRCRAAPAASDCRRLTVGSSPYSSSPTSASAIARRISGVGVVNVSLRSSTPEVTTSFRRFTGRMRPSCITVTASAPSWRKMKPSARPRAPCADGLFW